ncbi:holin [Vibrio phage Ceto]|uniref:Putative hoin n=1 Tax=Vibrio phage Ceto TaxID=2570300 RepID=A0A2H5BGK7_9CAUD|nr:holin [Vibrio phage Ceto]AUG85132.1 putative hoin [Vibrio phage Ceto]
MNKMNLLASLYALLQDIKDPKTLLMRVISIFILLVSYLIVTNQSTFFDFAKNFSRTTVVEQVQAERVAQYPRVAKEKASMLYVQANSDAVFIAEYTPKFINNYQDIIAWEGRINVDPSKLRKAVIDKASTTYQNHLVGRNESILFENKLPLRGAFVTNGLEYQSLGIKYMYTCPIFNQANSYSGYIGIAWAEKPFEDKNEKALLEAYLERVCNPQARALGRSK